MADIPTDVRGPYFAEEAPEMELVDRGWELQFMTNDKQCIVIHMPERALKRHCDDWWPAADGSRAALARLSRGMILAPARRSRHHHRPRHCPGVGG
jgi:hypothetical protein